MTEDSCLSQSRWTLTTSSAEFIIHRDTCPSLGRDEFKVPDSDEAVVE